MSILKLTCPHCKFNYVLPENKVPSGEITLTCPSCQQTYVYAKPEPGVSLRRPEKEALKEPNISVEPGPKKSEQENRPFFRQTPAPEPAPLRVEPEKSQESSIESPQSPSGEKKGFRGWEPVGLPEVAEPVQTPTENISEAPPEEEKRSYGWQPIAPQEEPEPVQTPAETPAVEEQVFVRYEPENLEKPKPIQAPPPPPISKASVEKPSPAPKPATKVVKKAVTYTPPRRERWAKWVVAALVVCAAAVSIAIYKPIVVTKVKEAYNTSSDYVKQYISLLSEKPRPKSNMASPSQQNVAFSSTSAIVRPSNFREISGTWTGRLRSDRQGPKWTFSFNPANYEVSIKSDSGIWIQGTAVFHWDQGFLGDTLRVAPNWHVLDIDVIKSSINEYTGKASLGAFSLDKDDLKLCMSRPGKMVQPTETDASGEIQCFDLKKRQ